MKSWKEQLRDLKSALRESGRGKERGDEPRKIDFEPPSSWLAGDRSIPKNSPARNPVQQSAPSGTVGVPAGKPSARPSRPVQPALDHASMLDVL